MVNNYGVTENGFVIRSYGDVVTSLENSARRMFGDDVDLTPGSPIKSLLDIFALEMTGLWASLKSTYDAGYVMTATGNSLDNLASLVALERKAAGYATGNVTFFRSTALPAGTPKVIPAGTIVKTTDIYPMRYLTTATVYFIPEISGEEHSFTVAGTEFDCTNVIHSITSIVDSDANDLTAGATFSYRTVTLSSEVAAGKSVFVTYKPLSTTAPVRCEVVGAMGNTPANTITVMDSPLSFIHSIGNESSLDTGYDEESDASLQYRLINATQSVGKATPTALEYYLTALEGVTSVTIEDPLRVQVVEEIVANGTATFYVSNTPLYDIASVVGSTSGTLTVDAVNADTGEVTLTGNTSNGETLTVTYRYLSPGQIKLYVEGGTVGDEHTPGTIVYTIENTRAAGVQSVGYGSGDSNAYGSDTAPFSWFYRTERVPMDVTMTVTFNISDGLTPTARAAIKEQVVSNIFNYINAMDINERLYKSRLISLAISSNEYIVNAALDSWAKHDTPQSTDLSYIQGADMESPLAQNIVVNDEIV